MAPRPINGLYQQIVDNFSKNARRLAELENANKKWKVTNKTPGLVINIVNNFVDKNFKIKK